MLNTIEFLIENNFTLKQKENRCAIELPVSTDETGFAFRFFLSPFSFLGLVFSSIASDCRLLSDSITIDAVCAADEAVRLHRFLTGFPYLVSLLCNNTSWFYWLELGFTRLLQGYSEFYWISLAFTGFRWVLLGFTGFYWVLLGRTRFYWVL